MASQTDRPPVPRAVIHKRILDAAADQPDAALDKLAADIPVATAELVEKVLDEYGDPADEEPDDPLESETSQMSESPNWPDLDNLSESQRKTLRAIAENPDATQSEIADTLGVSAPTVSNRVNAIEGFDWTDRQALVETKFNGGQTMQEEDTDLMASSSTESTADTGYETEVEARDVQDSTESSSSTADESTIDELTARVSALEKTVENMADRGEAKTVFGDLELTHKMVHASLIDDKITEEEELQILKALLR